MQKEQDASRIYNFAYRVKTMSDSSYKWYFASAKLLYEPEKAVADKMPSIVNEVNSLDYIAKKNSVLDESDWMKKHFKTFCQLTGREEEIIVLLINGKFAAYEKVPQEVQDELLAAYAAEEKEE